MRCSKLAAAFVAAMFTVGTVQPLLAEDAPQEQKKVEKKAPAPKLPGNYGKLTTLTDDQKAQLVAIAKKLGDERKALEVKYAEEMKGVLTAEQKAELEAILAKEAEAKKAKEAEAKKAKEEANKAKEGEMKKD